MIIDYTPKLDFCDVLLVPCHSELDSRSQVSLVRTFNNFKWSPYKINCIPIFAANMHKIGTLKVAKELSKLGLMTCLSKHISVSDMNNFLHSEDNLSSFFSVETSGKFFDSIAFSTGSKEEDISRLFSLMTAFPQVKTICIDVANGYRSSFLNFIADFRKDFKDHIIIAGNVVTSDQACRIIDSGADIVKVGIGSGSVCSTRNVTGVGYPQLSAVLEMQESVHDCGGFLMSDGGCQVPGDIAKAFAANADFVMLGGMLSGHNECVHEGTDDPCSFYGMSSYHAMETHYGSIAEYRSSEGKVVTVSAKGSISNTIQEILGGIRSACTYINCPSIEHMNKNAKFIIANRQINGMFN